MNRQLFLSIVLHYLAYCCMQTLALMSETRRGPNMSDTLHDIIPMVVSLNWFNGLGWLFGLLFSIIYLGIFHRLICIDYLRIGAILSALRGLFISLTSLGPPFSHANAIHMEGFSIKSIKFELLLRHWLPIDILWGGSQYSAFHLTQDLPSG